MYFIRGSLPWQGLKINRKDDRYKKICEKKRETSAKDLCSGFPAEFERFVSYTRNLQFMEVPNYNHLRDLLKTVIKNSGFKIDFYYDWCTTKPNIKLDDPIYTNDYKIDYNGPNEWLNNTNSKNDDVEQNENNEDYKTNEKGTSIVKNSHGMHNGHNRGESNNLSTKCVDSDSKANNMPFGSSKKIK